MFGLGGGGGFGDQSSGSQSQSQSSAGAGGSQEPAWDNPDLFNDDTFGLGTGLPTGAPPAPSRPPPPCALRPAAFICFG